MSIEIFTVKHFTIIIKVLSCIQNCIALHIKRGYFIYTLLVSQKAITY